MDFVKKIDQKDTQNLKNFPTKKVSAGVKKLSLSATRPSVREIVSADHKIKFLHPNCQRIKFMNNMEYTDKCRIQNNHLSLSFKPPKVSDIDGRNRARAPETSPLYINSYE